MKFRTEVELPLFGPLLNTRSKVVFLGSCFAENIGKRMKDTKLNCLVNPFGVLYNPYSISSVLSLVCQQMDASLFEFPDRYLFEKGGLWRSWLHSTAFSHTDKDMFVSQINEQIRDFSSSLFDADGLFITFGTNHFYELIDSGLCVANCHKQPSRLFVERAASVSEISTVLKSVLHNLFLRNPSLKVVFTVSPFRYAKLGAHGNQISKSTLLLSVDELCNEMKGKCFYFPSYEIQNDELRDYRFYGEDMLHPSSQAIDFIWQTFAESSFSDDLKLFLDEWKDIKKALEHKPFDDKSSQYLEFREKTLMRLEKIKQSYPYLKW